AAIDQKLDADFAHVHRQISEPDVFSQSGRRRSGSAGADGLAGAVEQRITVAGYAAAGHLEADELSREPLLFDAQERVLSHEIRLFELHGPAEAGLERIRGFVDVVTVERKPRLEAQRVARAEPGGGDLETPAGLEQRSPEPD